MQSHLKVVVYSLISIFFIALILWNINVTKIAENVSRVSLQIFLLACMVYLSSFFFRGIRWRQILLKNKKIGLGNSTKIALIGFMVNNILPARLGELVRPYVLFKKEEVKYSIGLSSVLAERLIDGLTLIMMFVAIIFLMKGVPGAITGGLYLVGTIFLMIFILLICACRRREWFTMSMGRLFGMLSKKWGRRVEEASGSFLQGLSLISEVSLRHLSVWLLSFVIWLIEALVFHLYFLTLGIGAGFVVALLVVIVVNIGILIPSAPGYVGIFEWFFVFTLGLFAIESSLAISAAILVHITQYLTASLAGLVSIPSLGLKWRGIMPEGVKAR